MYFVLVDVVDGMGGLYFFEVMVVFLFENDICVSI